MHSQRTGILMQKFLYFCCMLIAFQLKLNVIHSNFFAINKIKILNMRRDSILKLIEFEHKKIPRKYKKSIIQKHK